MQRPCTCAATTQLINRTLASARLSSGAIAGTLPAMNALARLLQLVGLVIPPLAIIAQLNEHISLGKMLGFLVAAMCIFGIGYLLQHRTGGGSA